MVLNMGPLDWESSDLTTRPSLVCTRSISSETPDSPVSYGTFLKLKPFYVRSVTLPQNVEMHYCKKHLHAQSHKWVIVIWMEHTSTVYLGGPEGLPPWLGARSEKIFEFRVPRLA